MTAWIRIPAFVCLAVLLITSGCSKPDEGTPAEQDSAATEIAGEFDADAASGGDAGPAVDPAKALVTVNGTALTYGEADAMVRRMLASQGAPEAQMEAILRQMGPSMRERVADQFIASTLLKNEAQARKIEITDADVNAAMSNLTERLPPGSSLEAELEKVGVTLEKLRQDIRDNERIRKLYNAETEGIAAATDAEIATYYSEHAEEFTQGEEVTARHILIGSREEEADKKDAARAKAEGLRKQLVEGADFAELAAANSDCPSKSDGGNLGSFGRGRMVPAFEEAAFALATNAISDVVETPFGFHIIQVTGRKDAGKTELADVREKIADRLTATKRNEAFEKVIEGLRAKATIIEDKPETAPADAADAADAAPPAAAPQP